MKKRGLIALLVVLAMLLPAIPVFAANYTLSGTISLPSGVTASSGDYLYVNAYPVSVDGTKRIINGGYYSRNFRFTAGANNLSYTFSGLSGGYYIIETEANIGNNFYRFYYNSAGCVRNIELGECVDLRTSGKTVNMTIPTLFNRTISGTITLDKPAEYDGYINLSLSGVLRSVSGSSQKVSFAQGQTTASYSIDAGTGIYELYMDGAGYYSIDGDFSYKKHEYYIDTTNGSVSNIDATLDSAVLRPSSSGGSSGSGSSGEDDETDEIPITVTIPYGSTDYTYLQIEVGIKSTEQEETNFNEFDSQWVDFEIGETSSREYIYIPDDIDEQICIAVSFDGYNNRFFYTGSGLSADINQAAEYSPNISSLNINLSNALYIVKGTVSRNGAKQGEKIDPEIMLYIPDSENGNNDMTFGATVWMNADETSVPYTILVPSCLSGQECEIFLDYSGAPEEQTVQTTVRSGIVQNLSYHQNAYKQVSGTITLDSPAPPFGVAVHVGEWAYNSDLPYFIIPAGQRTVNYSIYVPNDSDDNKRIYANSVSENANYDDLEDNAYLDNAGSTLDFALYPCTKTVRGNVRIAESVTLESAVSYEIFARSQCYEDNRMINLGGEYVYGTIRKGASSSSYSINIPSNSEMEDVYISIYDGDMNLLCKERYEDVEIPASGTLSNVDFTLFDKMLVYFNAKNMPEMTDYDEMTATVKLDNGKKTTVEFDNDGTAVVEFPKEDLGYTDSFTVCYSVNIHTDNDGIYEYDNMYINPDGTLTHDEYEAVSYPVKALTNIDFILENNSILLDESTVTFGGASYNDENDTVTIQFKNYDVTVYNATAIVAVYDENNTLVYAEPHIIKIDDSFETEFTSAIKDKVPAGGCANLLLWQNTGNIKPIVDVISLYSDNQD